MFARIRKSMEEREGGFTLIELLVVMIIIGILAAIAIPTFLNQRENGYRSAMKADLKNAATALESAAVDASGDYTVGGAVAAGATVPIAGTVEFIATANVTTTVDTVSGITYCLEAVHSSLAGETWKYDKATGVPVAGTC